MAGDGRDDAVDARAPDRRRDVAAADRDAAVGVERDLVRLGEGRERGAVLERGALRSASQVSARYIAPVSR